MTVYDAFGVARPDLIAKADVDLDSKQAKHERRMGTFWGPVYASTRPQVPKGERVATYSRHWRRTNGEGLVGGVGGAAVGAGAAALTRGKVKVRPLYGGLAGGLIGNSAGGIHGSARAMRETQRRYGVGPAKRRDDS